MTEQPSIIASGPGRIVQKVVVNDGSMPWTVSRPTAGIITLGVWQIYHGIQLMLSAEEDGKYNISRSVDGNRFDVVHSHSTEIYGVFYVDEGLMLFSATDGWWATTNSGDTWTKINSGPGARSVAVINSDDLEYDIIAYGLDRIVRKMEYPGGDWSQVVDTSNYWQFRWHPAIAGSFLGVLIGIGPYLLFSDGGMSSWTELAEFDGVVKQITLSDRGFAPTVLVEVEEYDTSDSKVYTSHDFADSVVLDATRINPAMSVSTVYPTGTNTLQSINAVAGKRVPGKLRQYRINFETRDR